VRAFNLSQLVGENGRYAAKGWLLLRACLLSGIGHAAALVSMALVVYGGGGKDAARSAPLLTVLESDPQPPLDSDQFIQTSQTERQRLPFESTTLASEAIELRAVRLELVAGAPGLPGHSLTSALQVDGHLAQEIDEKTSDSLGEKLGRSANFYGIEADGRKFVFVLDISGSMSGSRFRRARTELCKSIAGLDPLQSFFVILFNDAPNLMPSAGLAAVNPVSLRLVDEWLKTTECRGGTNPLPALFGALAMQPDAVFLLSDGKFDPALAHAVSELETYQRIPIHTIGFASRKGEPILRAISQLSGGTYRHVR
jgi:hypothetical protein